jgi:hypothetical protein
MSNDDPLEKVIHMLSECSSGHLSMPTQLESATEAQVKERFALATVGCVPTLVGTQGTVSANGV